MRASDADTLTRGKPQSRAVRRPNKGLLLTALRAAAEAQGVRACRTEKLPKVLAHGIRRRKIRRQEILSN